MHLYPPHALANEKDAVDKQAIGGALDLEVAEKSVGTEEREDFVELVVGLAVRVDVQEVRARGEWGEDVGGSARTGA